MSTKVYFHSTEAVKPEAMAVLARAKENAGITEKLDFHPLPEKPFKHIPVLSLGRLDRALPDENRVILAPSVGALVTKADSITRMTEAFKLLVGNIEDLGEMRYKVEERIDWLVSYLDSCEGRLVAFDIETSGDVDADEPDYSQIISVALWGGSGSVMVIPEHVVQDSRVHGALDRFVCRNKLITVNGKFDLTYFPVEAVNFFDVLIAHYILNPAGSDHGLKPQAKNSFGVGDWDEPAKKYTKAKTYKEAGTDEDGVWWSARKYSGGSGFERIPRTLLYEYNAYDVFYTWHLYKLRLRELEEAGEKTLFAFQRRMAVSDMFAKIERSKFTIDREHLEALREKLTEELEVAREELTFIAECELNPNSPKQIHEWFNGRGMPLPKLKVKSGPDKGKLKPSTSADAMAIVVENVKGKYDDRALDFAEKLLEIRGIVKNLGTYVNGFLDRAHGNQIRPTFNVTGPMTGRIANRGAGILTIPRDPLYRQMIVPSGPGRVLVKPDYGQLEMRLVAYYSGDPRFVAAFQPGMPDFFTAMMPEVYPDLDLTKLTKAEHKEKRNGVKPISHGANYGRSYAAIAEQLGMPLSEAKAIYDRYMGDPNVGLIPWQNGIREKATTGEEIVTDYGFHYQAEIVSEKNKNSIENSALAFIPQSTGNDITLGAAMTIQPQLAQYDAWLIATIHDQIIADTPIEHAKTVGALMEKAMLEEAQKVVKGVLIFEAQPEYGFHWAEIMDPDQWDEWLENNGYTA